MIDRIGKNRFYFGWLGYLFYLDYVLDREFRSGVFYNILGWEKVLIPLIKGEFNMHFHLVWKYFILGFVIAVLPALLRNGD